jgi:hypothetical protein
MATATRPVRTRHAAPQWQRSRRYRDHPSCIADPSMIRSEAQLAMDGAVWWCVTYGTPQERSHHTI